MHRHRHFIHIAAAAIVLASPAVSAPAPSTAQQGKIYKVGPDEQYKEPSEVANLVRSGDTVQIAPGSYVNCAVWPANVNGLTIEGKDVTIRDQNCAGKGLFVVYGNNTTIRGITFSGGKVRDHNGAAIRTQGVNLTVENSRFINNENGILGGSMGSTIIVRNSYFENNGNCDGNCSHAIYMDRGDRLHVEGSTFVDTHHGHHIKSRAFRTEIVNNDIHDGPNGNSSYLIDASNGGDLIVTGNKLEKGPNAENRCCAIAIGTEAQKVQNPTNELRIENNTFRNDLNQNTIFVKNWLGDSVSLKGNTMQGRVTVIEGPGKQN